MRLRSQLTVAQITSNHFLIGLSGKLFPSAEISVCEGNLLFRNFFPCSPFVRLPPSSPNFLRLLLYYYYILTDRRWEMSGRELELGRLKNGFRKMTSKVIPRPVPTTAPCDISKLSYSSSTTPGGFLLWSTKDLATVITETYLHSWCECEDNGVKVLPGKNLWFSPIT